MGLEELQNVITELIYNKDFKMNLTWFQSAVFCGILAGTGMIICRKVGDIHVVFFVGFLGLIWVLLSGGIWTLQRPTISWTTSIFLLASLAAILLWADNLCRFYAFSKSKNTALILLTIEVTMISLVLFHDLFALYRAKRLGSISVYEIGGLLLGIGALVMLRMAPERKVQE